MLKAYFKKDMNSLRLLHYPPQRPEDDGEHLGARAHTDTNAFTILAQDNNGGLEIRNRDSEWVAVPPIEGTFVVNVGEVLKVWTDGIFSSTLHRVINRSGRERFSIPFFMYPSYDALIQPLLKIQTRATSRRKTCTRRCRAIGRSSTASSRRKARRGSCPAKLKLQRKSPTRPRQELEMPAYVIGEAHVFNPAAMTGYGGWLWRRSRNMAGAIWRAVRGRGARRRTRA